MTIATPTKAWPPVNNARKIARKVEEKKEKKIARHPNHAIRAYTAAVHEDSSSTRYALCLPGDGR